MSEENGILISMMLRQYFMSLKVLDKWAHWGASMSRHWDQVVTNVAKSHPNITPREAAPPTPTAEEPVTPVSARGGKKGWDHFSPKQIRARRSSVGPLTERDTDVDRDDASPPPEPQSLEGIVEEDTDEDHELRVMRKAFRKWCRKAGVRATAGDGLDDDEVDCDWTKAISPKVEGRITMIEE